MIVTENTWKVHQDLSRERGQTSTMESLKEKIEKSLEEGYEKHEILEVMEDQGYSKSEIGKALAHIST